MSVYILFYNIVTKAAIDKVKSRIVQRKNLSHKSKSEENVQNTILLLKISVLRIHYLPFHFL